jgi:hypothetical protein
MILNKALLERSTTVLVRRGSLTAWQRPKKRAFDLILGVPCDSDRVEGRRFRTREHEGRSRFCRGRRPAGPQPWRPTRAGWTTISASTSGEARIGGVSMRLRITASTTSSDRMLPDAA